MLALHRFETHDTLSVALRVSMSKLHNGCASVNATPYHTEAKAPPACQCIVVQRTFVVHLKVARVRTLSTVGDALLQGIGAEVEGASSCEYGV